MASDIVPQVMSIGGSTFVPQEVVWGTAVLAYHRVHLKQSIVVPCETVDEASPYRARGWDIYQAGHHLIARAPEVVLCDLTEFERNPPGVRTPEEILTSYFALRESEIPSLLDEAIRRDGQLRGLATSNIIGASMAAEIRIAGSDTRVRQLPRAVMGILRNSAVWSRAAAQAQDVCWQDGGAGDQLSTTDSGVSGLFALMPKMFDRYVFALDAGIYYAEAFVAGGCPEERIALRRMHVGLRRARGGDSLVRGSILGHVAALDRAYTGRTLNLLAQDVTRRCASVTRFALFPKSAVAVAASDFSFVLDRCVPSDSIDLSEPDWAIRLLGRAAISRHADIR